MLFSIVLCLIISVMIDYIGKQIEIVYEWYEICYLFIIEHKLFSDCISYISFANSQQTH